MEVDRGDKMNVTRTADIIRSNGSNDALPNETPEKPDENTPSLTFSSERFNFSTFAEDPSIDCIDKAGSMFKELKKEKPPTLKEALTSMGYGEKTEELFRMFTDKANGRLEEIEAPGLSVEDVAAVFCYTYEWDKKKFGSNIDSPYRKLNKSISVDRSNPALRKTRAFLFLLLRALRKLPRYTPANKTLYRGINVHVQTEVDPEHPETKPYTKGNEKTWWTFTSTTENLEVTRYFVQRNKGTLFTLSGEAWGYDISVFSNFPDEKEILLEPERRLKIKNVKNEGAVITVNAEILDTPLVLKDYIKVKPVKIKEKKSDFKDVPRNLRIEEFTKNTVTLSWDAPEKNSDKVLLYQVSARQTSDRFINRNPESTYIVKKEETRYIVRDLEEGKDYEFRVRCKYSDGWGKEWCKEVLPFSWKECPSNARKGRKYKVDGGNPRIATGIGGGIILYDDHYTIIGNTHIPLNTVTSWNIKVLKSKENGGEYVYIGVAPPDINQNNCNESRGWYYMCYDSTLRSGPPHYYNNKEYGPRKEEGQYVHDGDNVGVMIDTTKGDLSFVLSGANLGVAYEGIPLDKPLVPCVLLGNGGDSIELDISEIKESEEDSSIPVPSNAIISGTTWNTITLSWDRVEDASFYQIEVDGSKLFFPSATNAFTKRRLLPETDHSFRVRVVRGSSVGEWSGVTKGRTSKVTKFPECVWKECPDDVDDDLKYIVDEGNPRIATKINGYGDCTIIGNAPIPPSTVTSWSIKILKSKRNDGYGINIGVAPSNIDQSIVESRDKCGWYFECADSTLYSGPPHYYNDKEYGPRKKHGQYVHTGDSVGVVVDTTKGELSFFLNNANYGVAFYGIPLDKPLVPCAILKNEGDSIELNTSEVKENVNNFIPVPSNIIAKSTTWNSITLTWDEVSGASFYQIEVDESKSWNASTTNTFAKIELPPDTEHSFRVRAVIRNAVSRWCDVVKGKTLKESFETSGWKEYTDDIDNNKKYCIDEREPRVLTKISYCNSTIIGNTPIPLNAVTSWSIKVLKSGDNNGSGIYTGIAPSSIDQNEDDNYDKCGWYFYCYDSKLYSGPPHNYKGKKYVQKKKKKENGEYVHAGDSVGVVVDTTKGNISFVLENVKLGVAYEGIPLDKPLVPCVILCYKDDSIELIV